MSAVLTAFRLQKKVIKPLFMLKNKKLSNFKATINTHFFKSSIQNAVFLLLSRL